MLAARANSSHFALKEHLRAYLYWLEHVVLLSGAKYIVIAHAPTV
jgi:hypothetical protein